MTSSPTLCPTEDALIEEAARMLREGKIVAFPTETVYGLGADASNDRAVAAVFAAKDRPAFNPMIIHVPDVGSASRLVTFDERALRLASRFWPGPLTLVLPRKPGCPVALLAAAGLDTLGVRVPNHPMALALLAKAGRPVAAPSANPSSSISPTTAAHVAASMAGRVDMILDGGPCPVGVESSVVDLSGEQAVLLRPGGIPVEDIEDCIGPVARPAAGPVRAPGMLERHYAPGRPVRLNADRALPGEALLAFGPELPQYAPADTLNLSASGDLHEAAANLFSMLRALDAEPHEGIAVMRVPRVGLGLAINDRLRRAAVEPLIVSGIVTAGGCRAVVDPFELGD